MPIVTRANLFIEENNLNAIFKRNSMQIGMLNYTFQVNARNSGEILREICGNLQNV